MTTCTNKELETMSTKQDLSILAIIIGAFCSLGAFPGSLFAQCNPPGANTECWDGGGLGMLWSDKDNWNPDDLPMDADAVFHLIGGQIIMDQGDQFNPVPISSFVFDPEAGGSTLINSNKNLFVTGAFASDVFTVSARPDPDTLAVDSTTTGMIVIISSSEQITIP